MLMICITPLLKLSIYGICGTEIAWFRSYLSKRRQYVAYDNSSSSEAMIDYDIPQGSMIGPLIFIIYIKNSVHSSSCLKYIVFADDTNIFVSCNVRNV